MKFNPFKWLWETLKFFVADIKSDIKFLIDLKKGKVKVKKFSKEEWKELSIKSVLKENWIMFLLIFLAFVVGWFVASQYYQNVCNQFIWDTYVLPLKDQFFASQWSTFGNTTLNLSNFTGIPG